MDHRKRNEETALLHSQSHLLLNRMQMIEITAVHLLWLSENVRLHPEASMVNESGRIHRKFGTESYLRRQMYVKDPFLRKEAVTGRHQLNGIKETSVAPLTVKTTGADPDRLIRQPIERIYRNVLVRLKGRPETVDPFQGVAVNDLFLVPNKMKAIEGTLVPTTKIYINRDAKNFLKLQICRRIVQFGASHRNRHNNDQNHQIPIHQH